MTTRPILFINIEDNNNHGKITKYTTSRSTLTANSKHSFKHYRNINANNRNNTNNRNNRNNRNKRNKNKSVKNKNSYRPQINITAPQIRRELSNWQSKILSNRRPLNNREMFWIHQ
jgi:hypothetical protein